MTDKKTNMVTYESLLEDTLGVYFNEATIGEIKANIDSLRSVAREENDDDGEIFSAAKNVMDMYRDSQLGKYPTPAMGKEYTDSYQFLSRKLSDKGLSVLKKFPAHVPTRV